MSGWRSASRSSGPERLAFVLHDMFAVPFDEIAPIIDRSSDATRQLASRARRRVQGERAIPDGRALAVQGFTIAGGRIVEMDILAEPERLARLDLAAFGE